MKLLLCQLLAMIMFFLCPEEVHSFLAVRTSTLHTSVPRIESSLLAKKEVTEVSDKEDWKKGPAWKVWGRILITGSMDGVSQLGKRQHDWSTGKEMTKNQAYNWNTSAKSDYLTPKKK